MIYQVEYAGHPIRYALRYAETRYYFGAYMHGARGDNYDICATDEWMDHVRTLLPDRSPPPFVECRSLIRLTSNALLRHGCAIIHAVSFLWQDRVWLLTAPSGTGKTTQFLNWQRLFPGEITMICGDMPVLEGGEDGSVWVHSSPWNGKEGLGNRELSGPLGGIVFLVQGADNIIEPISIRDAIPALFRRLVLRLNTEVEILAAAALVERILRYAPVWLLTNRGDDASTELLRQTLLETVKGGRHDTL